MKKYLFILAFILIGCSKQNYENRCYVQNDYAFTIIDQDGEAYIKVYFESQDAYLRVGLPPSGREVSCAFIEKFFKLKKQYNLQ